MATIICSICANSTSFYVFSPLDWLLNVDMGQFSVQSSCIFRFILVTKEFSGKATFQLPVIFTKHNIFVYENVFLTYDESLI